MNISASGASAPRPIQPVQARSEASEPSGMPDNDGDADDMATAPPRMSAPAAGSGTVIDKVA